MTPERWRRITAVFHGALERDTTARGDFLEEACRGDHALRAEVDQMLAAHRDAGAAKGVPVDFPPVRDEAGYRRAIKDVAGSQAGQAGSPIEVARVYTQAGEKELAIDWLEKAFEQRNANLVYIGLVPALDPLRSEPRFQALLRRLKLPYD